MTPRRETGRRALLGIAVAAVAALGLSCAREGALRVTLLFTGDVSGYLEPCG